MSLDVNSNIVSDTDDSICTPPLQLSCQPKMRFNNLNNKRRGSKTLRPSQCDHVSFKAEISAQSSSNDTDEPPTFLDEVSIVSCLQLVDEQDTKEQLQNEEKAFLKQKGLILGHKLCDTLQGGLYAATTLKGLDVVIKKTDRNLCLQREAVQDGMSIVVEENIIKEVGIYIYSFLSANLSAKTT